MPIQKTTCPKCGNINADLVPAGIAKASGKPYGSFVSCKGDGACGQTTSVGPQPPKQRQTGQANASTSTKVYEQMDRIERGINELLKRTTVSEQIDPKNLDF